MLVSRRHALPLLALPMLPSPAAALPADVATARSSLVQRGTPEQVVAGIGTRSYAATMTAAAREEFLGGIRRLLAGHPDTAGRDVLDLPYRTDAYRLTPR